MISGIVAEFNIFHNGHKYLIDMAREFSDYIICIMSGPFVQRGDVAVVDKWTRAKCALMCGADLVLELPVCYALSAAPNFASGAINTLDALGICDTLVFGSECGDISALSRAADLLDSENIRISEKIKALLAEGMSYPSAVDKALKLSENGILNKPNNILAVEYIRAVKRRKGMNAVTFRRIGAEHDGSIKSDSFASASELRKMLLNNEDISKYIPYPVSEVTAGGIYILNRLDSALAARLRTMSADELKNISEVTEGLENRILRAAAEHDSFDDIAAFAKSKRYTMSKIRRILISALLNYTKDIYSPNPEYIRVLGLNANGAKLLKQAKKSATVPIITKTADFKGESSKFMLDLRASDIAALCSDYKTKRRSGSDLVHSPVVI